MAKWEYYDTITSFYGGRLQEFLNKRGEDGWELVKIFDGLTETIEDKEFVVRGRFLFKRKIED